MPVDRLNPAALGRLCESSRAPIYAVDRNGKLIYVNAALADWAGFPARELVGQRCVFGDDPAAAPAARIAAALCPQPQDGSIRPVAGTIHNPLLPAAPTVAATWIVLPDAAGNACGTLGVLAIADASLTNADAEFGADFSSSDAHAALQAHRAAARQAFHFDALVGTSHAVRAAAARVALFAPLDAPLWIAGPRGSGRRALARAIHHGSNHKDRALIEADCALLTEEVFVARLRGLAVSAEIARGGTLLLLNLERASDEVRRKTLLFHRKHPAWRMIATAEVAPAAALAAGVIDRDAADAFAAVVELPPLVARIEDLPLLTQAIIERENTRSERQFRGLAPDALDLLAAHRWPGDVAELEAALAAARQSASGAEIGVGDLPRYLMHAAHALAHPRYAPQPLDLTALLEQVERRAIEAAMRAARGNKTTAADFVGWSRARFYRRLVELGLIDADERTKSPEEPSSQRRSRKSPTRRSGSSSLDEARPAANSVEPYDAAAPHDSATVRDADFIADLPFLPADDEDEFDPRAESTS